MHSVQSRNQNNAGDHDHSFIIYQMELYVKIAIYPSYCAMYE